MPKTEAPKKKRKRHRTEYDKWRDLGLLQEKLFLMQGLAMEGKSMQEIADALLIGKTTLEKFKNTYPEVYQVLSRTKKMTNLEVINALYKKCKEGDVTAIKFWLANKDPENWREKRDYNHTVVKKAVVIDDSLGEDYEDDEEE